MPVVLENEVQRAGTCRPGIGTHRLHLVSDGSSEHLLGPRLLSQYVWYMIMFAIVVNLPNTGYMCYTQILGWLLTKQRVPIPSPFLKPVGEATHDKDE